MPITDELTRVARLLGETIRANKTVQLYLLADSALQSDPEARDLDQRYQAMYEGLVARQRAGEPLPQDELDTFYELQAQVQLHPLIQDRNRKLGMAKRYLQPLGAEFNQKLGLDYATLVLS